MFQRFHGIILNLKTLLICGCLRSSRLPSLFQFHVTITLHNPISYQIEYKTDTITFSTHATSDFVHTRSLHQLHLDPPLRPPRSIPLRLTPPLQEQSIGRIRRPLFSTRKCRRTNQVLHQLPHHTLSRTLRHEYIHDIRVRSGIHAFRYGICPPCNHYLLQDCHGAAASFG